MLVPAVFHKDEIIKEMKKYYYTEDMMYMTGSLNNWYPDIKEQPECYLVQYAIVNNENKLIGYMSYYVDYYISKVYNFVLVSFDRGNILIGKDVFSELEKLVNKFHRVEWRALSTNPACKGYDSFIKMKNGKKHILKDSIKDKNGEYIDDVIYEIVN